MSSQPSFPPIYPPISQVMTRNKCLDILDQLGTYMRTKNANAIKHIGEILTELGLDHITAAFLKWLEQKLICQNCGNQVGNPDELCYCPNAAERCHHGTSCCNMHENLNYYELLGVDERAKTPINRERMRGYHPDKEIRTAKPCPGSSQRPRKH
uniref:Uncharacterized protein n=1 Tax=Globodera rostochiensis TaxID=31243 RepID=A0A914IDP5_GLORO